MIDEVSISQAEHEAISQGINDHTATGLRDTSSAAAGSRGGCSRHDCLKRSGGVCRRGEIHLHPIEIHPGSMDRDEDARSASRRRRESVQVRGHVAAFGSVDDDLPGGGAISREHLGAIHGREQTADVAAGRSAGGKGVGHHVVGVGPAAKLRIVAEVAIGDGKGVAKIGAAGVSRGGDGDALEVGTARGGGSKLRDQPTIGYLVIDHNRIAIVAGRAVAADKTGPKCIDIARPGQRCDCAVDPVERPHLISGVDRLDVLVVTHRAVSVRGKTRTSDLAEEIEAGGRRGWSGTALSALSGWRDLDDRVRLVGMGYSPRGKGELRPGADGIWHCGRQLRQFREGR
ncbi:MAG: hypothetical protein DME97_06970 [Verrucomicrobia bacterium]|nr:MAG: hypothetical protein DME97_06970 [Verrucomicrobiota bacterium]